MALARCHLCTAWGSSGKGCSPGFPPPSRGNQALSSDPLSAEVLLTAGRLGLVVSSRKYENQAYDPRRLGVPGPWGHESPWEALSSAHTVGRVLPGPPETEVPAEVHWGGPRTHGRQRSRTTWYHGHCWWVWAAQGRCPRGPGAQQRRRQ